MGIVNGIRTIDNLVAGSLSGAQYNSLLATGINQAGFLQAVNSRSQNKTLLATPAAINIVMGATIGVGSYLNQIIVSNGGVSNTELAGCATFAAVLASTSAMSAVAQSSAAICALLSSGTAITAAAENNTMLATLFSLAAYRTVLYDSHSAALFSSANAKAYMISIATEVTTGAITHVSVNTGKTFFVQQKSNSSYNSYAGISANTYTTSSTTYIDRFLTLIGLTHRTSSSGGTSYCTYIDMD